MNATTEFMQEKPEATPEVEKEADEIVEEPFEIFEEERVSDGSTSSKTKKAVTVKEAGS